MAQIMMSLPVAFFIYRVIFGITFYTQLHILAIFLVLGVGADDVFVFVDGWKQSATLCTDDRDRLMFSFHRASRSVFNTSFTTAFAFAATALSPVMPVSSFGVSTGGVHTPTPPASPDALVVACTDLRGTGHRAQLRVRVHGDAV